MKNTILTLMGTIIAASCYAQPSEKGIPVRTLDVVQNAPANMRCKSSGNEYSIGATIVQNNSTFQCIQVYKDPVEQKSVMAAWVQIQLAENGKKK